MKRLLLLIFLSLSLLSCRSKKAATPSVSKDSTFSIDALVNGKKLDLLDVEIVVEKVNDSLKIRVIKNNVKPSEIRKANRINKLKLKGELAAQKYGNKKAVNKAKSNAKIEKIENKSKGIKLPFKVKVVIGFFSFLFLLMIGVFITAWVKSKLE